MSEPYRNILLVYPRFGVTYFGLEYCLPLIGKKAPMPPLGLLTIAALTPSPYEVRLVDLNCGPLSESDLAWADIVCVSAMLVQRPSLFEISARCRAAGKLVVFGGPFPTACPDECAPHCDVLVLNEGEVTWPLFLADLARGSYGKRYTSDEKPDVTRTPIPRFDLVNTEAYGIMPVQFSRGCPFQCEFCDIIVMFGRKPRTKTAAQFCAELQALYDLGYRGGIFIVDDNFIGNKREVRKLLPELVAWNEAHGKPFTFATEASIDLADDPELLRGMVDAGFTWVFVGIETPSEASLTETLKFQNTKRPLLDSVKRLHAAGLLVFAGFIIGFDNDKEDIFERQIDFITRAGISMAVVGLLQALPGTPLYRRLQQAGRLKSEPDVRVGDHCGYGYTNIVTLLPPERLLAGYRDVIATLYAPREFFGRARIEVAQFSPPPSWRARIRSVAQLHRLNVLAWSTKRRTAGAKKKSLAVALWQQAAVLRAILAAAPPDYARESLRFTWAVLRRCPERLPMALALVTMGLHLYRFSFEHVIPNIDERRAELANGERRLVGAASGMTR